MSHSDRVLHPETENQIRDIIKNSSNLLLVDFFATWCGPCRYVAPILSKMSLDYPTVSFMKVDVDKHYGVSQTYGISAMPTFIFFRDGKPIGKPIRGANVPLIEQTIDTHDKPLSSEAYRKLGNYYLQKHSNMEESLHWYNLALPLATDTNEEIAILSNSSLVHLKTGQYLQSLKEAEKILSILKEKPEIKYFKGNYRYYQALKKLGKFEKSKKFLENLSKEENFSSEEKENIKTWLDEINQEEKKESDPNQAEELCSDAENEIMINSFEKAVQYYSEAIVLNSKEKSYFKNRAEAFLNLKEYDLTIEDCDEFLNDKPDADVCYLKASALKEKGNIEEAKKVISLGLELDSNNVKLNELKSEF